jgi:hypothetical protein
MGHGTAKLFLIEIFTTITKSMKQAQIQTTHAKIEKTGLACPSLANAMSV